jgi:hypothetical protein
LAYWVVLDRAWIIAVNAVTTTLGSALGQGVACARPPRKHGRCTLMIAARFGRPWCGSPLIKAPQVCLKVDQGVPGVDQP